MAITTACGGSDSRPESAGQTGGGSTVLISNFEFSPEVVQAKVGDTITVENRDSAEHTVTAADNSFDTGRFASAERTFTVTKAGRFEYACNVHPYMKPGFIQVAG
ncbi:MAG: cupredoxin domain-containing protein [Acidimicrobiales bacterium]